MVVRVLDHTGTPLSFEEELVLEEARRYTVDVGPGNRVWLGARELARNTDGEHVLVVTHWVGVNLLRWSSGEDESSVRVRVTPRTEKLSVDTWVSLLSDLEDWLPALSVGAEGGRAGSVGSGGVPASFLVEALLPLVPQLERAVRTVLRDPRERALTVWEDVPLHRARRVDRETLAYAGRHPTVSLWLDRWAEQSGAEPNVPQRSTLDTLDHPANRYLSWLLCRVVHVLQETAAALREAKGEDDSVAWCHARGARVVESASRLDRLWRQSFLRRLKRVPPTEAALLVVLDDPTYARVHGLGRRFISPLFTSQTGGLTTGVKPSFTIYELWCFLRVSRLLQARLPGLQWQFQHTRKLFTTAHGTGAKFVGKGADESWTLHFNPVFSSFHARGGAERWSVSTERRPDLVVTHESKTGEGRWLGLDAKYRAGRANLGNAFESVHVYRDSLRWDRLSGPCVAFALLAPATAPDAPEWFSEKFRAEHLCGIWELRPGSVSEVDLANWVVEQLTKPI